MTDLEQDKSILEISCKENRRLQNCETVKQLKLSLYNAARSGEGIVKAKTYRHTKEGDKIINYLIVEQGSVRLISGYSRDETSPPAVKTIICSSLELAYIEDYLMGNPKLKPFIDKDIKEAKNKKILVLVCLDKNQNQLENGYRF